MRLENINNQCSAIIVSYHTGAVLLRVIESMLKQTNLLEIILIDNNNPIETINELHKISRDHAKLKIISGHGNIGFAKGCNLGARHAASEYLLFINPDAVLNACNSIDIMIKELESFPDAIMAGVKILNSDGYYTKN